MKIVVALDSFKGTLAASEACRTVAAVLRESHPKWKVVDLPMADGGEGTAATLIAACHGRWVQVDGVTGPLPEKTIRAGFGWLPDAHMAVVEMAAASGLPLLHRDERNPLMTTTRGTGELLAEAATVGAKLILLTLGGSATVDGGVGAARALGWEFLDGGGRPVPEGGRGLVHIHRIVRPRPNATRLPPVRALCDVTNPLCGPRGAAAVFGPQKGATPAMVHELDAGLRHLANGIHRDLGKDVLDMPGAGAAGGFGAGAMAFCDAELVPGVDTVADTCGLDAALKGAAWVITGEGRFDDQSLHGKVVCGVRNRAAKFGARVAVIAGRVALDEAAWRAAGIEIALACAVPEIPDGAAFASATERLQACAAAVAERLGKS